MNTRTFLVVCLQAFTACVIAGTVTLEEMNRAIVDGNFADFQSLIDKDGGVRSEAAADFLVFAARTGNQALLEKLLSANVPIDIVPLHERSAGETALMQATGSSQGDMVAFLLAKGANAKLLGRCLDPKCTGHAAIVGAARNGSVEIAQMLLKAGADPNVLNGFPLQYANQDGDVEMYELLMKYGARPIAATVPRTDARALGTPGAANNSELTRSLGLAQLLPGISFPGQKAPIKNHCRLAIIPDDANVASADVLAALLKAKPSLELVERQELSRILAEQKLTRQFATVDANYEKVATLLRADALLLVRTRTVLEAQVVEARFVRVNPGIALDTVYAAWPVTDPAGWANAMSQRLPNLAAKAIRNDVIALSLFDVTASLPTPEGRRLERTLTVLLHDRLSRDSRFVVLERSQMEKVAFENVGEKPFWTGGYLITPSVEVALNNSGTFTLTARFKPLPTGEAITVSSSGQRLSPARAVDDVLEKVRERLRIDGLPQGRDNTVEAGHYLEESRWAFAAGIPIRSAAAAEAAWALGLQTIEVANLRVRAALRVAREAGCAGLKLDPLPNSECLDYAIQGVGMWRDMLENNLLREHAADLRSWLELSPEVRDGTMLAMIRVKTAAEQLQLADRLVILRHLYWESLSQALVRASEFPATSGISNQLSRMQASSARLMLRSSGELLPVLTDIFGRHFATNNASTRAAIRTEFRWTSAMAMAPISRSGSQRQVLHLPRSEGMKKQVVRTLRESTSAEDQFLATMLEIATDSSALAPNDEEHLMEAFWGMRDLFAKDEAAFDVYYQRFKAMTDEPSVTTLRLYEVRLPTADQPNPAPVKLNHFEFKGQLHLYLSAHALRPQAGFEQLLTRSRYSTTQPAEVQRTQTSSGRTGALAPSVTRAATQLIDAPRANALEPLCVTRFWHPFDLGKNISPDFQFHHLKGAEGKIWGDGSVYIFSKPPETRRYIFAIDPSTLQTETIEIPQGPLGEGATPEVAFVVTPTNLVVTALKDFFAIYDRATRQWDIYREIKPTTLTTPIVRGGSAYFIVEDGTGMLRFDLVQRTTEVLASSRRNPAQTPLDQPGLRFTRFWEDKTGDIGVTALNDRIRVVQAWSPEQKLWHAVEEPRGDRASTTPNISASGPRLVHEVGRTLATVPANKLGDLHPIIVSLTDSEASSKEIAIRFALSDSVHLPPSRYGGQKLYMTLEPVVQVPGGYAFAPFGGPGFWFLPQKELDDYLLQARQAVATIQTKAKL